MTLLNENILNTLKSIADDASATYIDCACRPVQRIAVVTKILCKGKAIEEGDAHTICGEADDIKKAYIATMGLPNEFAGIYRDMCKIIEMWSHNLFKEFPEIEEAVGALEGFEFDLVLECF